MFSRLFRSGNSQALRIPKELAFPADMQDVEIERVGDTLVVRPVHTRAMTGLREVLAEFPPGFMTEGRGEQEQAERDWLPGP
jgi:antitoxin VapB